MWQYSYVLAGQPQIWRRFCGVGSFVEVMVIGEISLDVLSWRWTLGIPSGEIHGNKGLEAGNPRCVEQHV